MKFTYFHNPKCSKSRSGLELLKEKGVDFQVREYLKEPLKVSEIKQLSEELEMHPKEFVRSKETVFRELGLEHKDLDVERWTEVLAKYPQLLERPILSNGNRAVIGRPPEDLFKIV